MNTNGYHYGLNVGDPIPRSAAFIAIAWNEVVRGEPFNYELVDRAEKHAAINYERFRLRALNAKAAGVKLQLWREPYVPEHVALAIIAAREASGSYGDPEIEGA